MARQDETVNDFSNTARKTLAVDAYKEKFAFNGSGLVEYTGKANPGESIGSACWQIKKLVYSGTSVTDILWASSSIGFNSIWSGVGAVSTTHASYNYG